MSLVIDLYKHIEAVEERVRLEAKSARATELGADSLTSRSLGCVAATRR
jgi:hypothetical protein